MKPLPHGAPGVSTTMRRPNSVPFSCSLFACARYSSSRVFRADFEEAFVEVVAELVMVLPDKFSRCCGCRWNLLPYRAEP